MSEIILEGDMRAKELFEDFASEHPNEASIEVSKGADGASLICLVIENAPAISASIAMLVGTVTGRGIRMRASRDGVEVSVGELSKAT